MKATQYIELYKTAIEDGHAVSAVQMQMLYALRQDFEKTKTDRHIDSAEGVNALIREYHDKWVAICARAIKTNPNWTMAEDAWAEFKSHGSAERKAAILRQPLIRQTSHAAVAAKLTRPRRDYDNKAASREDDLAA